MTRRLIVANTYYQLIMAFQLRYTLFNKDETALLLSNHSKDAKHIYDNIKNVDTFDTICYYETKNIKRNFAEKCLSVLPITFGKNNIFTDCLSGIENLYFDEIISFNCGIDICALFNYFYCFNDSVKFSFFEEGILNYRPSLHQTRLMMLIRFIRHVCKKKDFADTVSKFYCVYPFFYDGEFQTVQIPRIYKESIVCKYLQDIFDCRSKIHDYHYKYIFFTSVYDFEGGEGIGEYQLVKRIAELVGIDNLLIKMHPRDTRSIYHDKGFHIDNNSSIPWEIIQLTGDFSETVFLTATSGSVLAGSLLSDSPVRTFYLYPLCDISHNKSAQNSVYQIERLLSNVEMKDALSKVRVTSHLQDILQ